MAQYKVIFRDERPGWQPGCPILIEAVQVSRNVETAQCYLQLRVKNIGGVAVDKIVVPVVVTTPQGETETVTFNSLDADIRPGAEWKPQAKAIRAMEVAKAEARVSVAGSLDAFAEMAPVPVPEEIELSDGARRERDDEIRRAGVNPDGLRGVSEDHDRWWLCSCGAVNVERGKCHQCGATRGQLAFWNDVNRYEAAFEKKKAQALESARGVLGIAKPEPEQTVAAPEETIYEEPLEGIPADETEGQEWVCTCGAVNFGGDICAGCGVSKRAAPVYGVNLSTEAEEPAEWTCTCGLINSRDEEVCSACGAAKPAKTLGEEAEMVSDSERNHSASNEAALVPKAKQETTLTSAKAGEPPSAKSATTSLKELEASRAAILALGDTEESKELLAQLDTQIAGIKKKKRTRLITLGSIAAAIVAGLLIWNFVVVPAREHAELYQQGVSALQRSDFDKAEEIFVSLGNYKDSPDMVVKVQQARMESEYQYASRLFSSGKYEEAFKVFDSLGDYKDSARKREELYQQGTTYQSRGLWEQAIVCFDALGSYKDSSTQYKESMYQLGLKYQSDKDWAGAIECFTKLGNYSDAKAQITKTYEMKLDNELSGIKVGSIVKIGTYEQDNVTSNGAEEIEWRVLAISGNKALLVSVYVLDFKPFHSVLVNGNNWDKSDLKKWLQGTFSKTAFSSIESARIQEVTLLSIDEVKKYFKDQEDRKCKPTQYAWSKAPSDGWAGWWLRSRGSAYDTSYYSAFYYSSDKYPKGINRGAAAVVWWDGDYGQISSSSSVWQYVTEEDVGIRPAIWVALP